ncbi:MAG: hypothetical protein K2J54_00390, partial [Clostridia bacterium]|nr:hypothetical protein [Clostridia bacterium]
MRWTKRLKWIKASKIIIPIALAISLVFAGFSVYANEAENFVLRTEGDPDVKLSLSFDKVNKTSVLYAPASGAYTNVSFDPDNLYLYDPMPGKRQVDLPNDIACHDGVHSCYNDIGQVLFYSFSFYLHNDSDRAVDVDMLMYNDGIVTKPSNDSGYHVDDALKIMLIEGEDTLLSDKTYLIYSKPESSEERQKVLYDNIKYEDNIVPFYSNEILINRSGDNGYRAMKSGEIKKFTLCIWLEGWDEDCNDPILVEKMKLSMDFIG